jgi:hypothetical protein
MKSRSLAAGLLLLVAGAACSNGAELDQANTRDGLLASVASKAINDSGFAIPAAIYVREALYEDEMAIQFEGDPEFLSEQDKDSIRASLGDLAAVRFFTDPSVVVDDDWNLLPDRLILLIGPIETEGTGQVVRVGVIAGSDLDDTYVGWYPVNPGTGEVGDSPRITMAP